MQILVGINQEGEKVCLHTKMANRHGLIAGATGTGKTVTLQVLAEAFSNLGVPVFTADVKGDLAGLCKSGTLSNRIQERLELVKLENFQLQPSPVIFWDLLQKNGHPVRTTISEMGPALLSRLMDLNDTQEGIIQIAFKYADDENLLLLDLKDLQELLRWLSDHSDEIKMNYGNVNPTSVAAIQRDLLVLEQSGAINFFAEPALEIKDLLRKDLSGKGIINILDASTLLQDGRLYSTFLLWLLSELFENLPEIGDQELPKLVFFFDEAHLLFNDAPKALLEKIELVVRLIRSKGVGIYFVTQNPKDLPEIILAQLGNRFQHALRAYTPAEQKGIKVASESFRANPKFKTEEAITNLEIGQALVSVLDLQGAPTIVEKTFIAPPHSRLGTISPEERTSIISASPLTDKYLKSVDRESAYEVLKKKMEAISVEAPPKPTGRTKDSVLASTSKSFIRSMASTIGRILVGVLVGIFLGNKSSSSKRSKSVSEQVTRTVGSSVKRTISNQIGTRIARGVLGSILK